jgi:hypothetical protein
MAPHAVAQKNAEGAGARLVRPRPGLWVGFEIIETRIETQVEQGTEIPFLWLLARKR